MKQVSQNYRTGAIRLEDVHAPALRRGGVLVQTQFSAISTGTEGMKAREGKLSYLGKARARPEHVKKVVQSIRQQGIMSTYQKVMNRLDSLTPLGYSLSGTVVAVGSGAEEFSVGQRVACAGAGYANHAEINFIPKNLVVPVPEEVAMDHAAFTTVGAIAMQGFRQGEVQLGESACVVGLGLLGQLLVQILKAAGARVVGIDVIAERCRLAEQVGAEIALTPDDSRLPSVIKRLTGGLGVDCTFIAAGGQSNGPVELAAAIARDRGRIVDIGKTRLDLPWGQYYEKELDVRFSRSYGPGRYDPNYEERGVDYPIGYVRWTERRNMAAFVGLLAGKQIDLAPIVGETHAFEDAERVYEQLSDGRLSALGVVFRHTPNVEREKKAGTLEVHGPSLREVPANGVVRVGLIGAGNYASTMLMPHLGRNRAVELKEVATRSALSAENAARKFGFSRTSTDYITLLQAQDIDAVVVATHHATHAELVEQALRAGKAVHVEKPLAIDVEGVERVRRAVTDSGNDRLLVGFNRRFAPLVGRMVEEIGGRGGPLFMQYRVHAGQLDGGSWYLDAKSHGSRFVGEAGHFFDLFALISGARPVSVVARSLRPNAPTQDDLENIAAIVEYDDGSVGELSYLTQGGARVPKEFLEVFGNGRTIQLHNFESLRVYDGDKERRIRAKKLDKGQGSQMERFVDAVLTGGTMPIPLDSLLDTTLVTLAVAQSLRSGETVYLDDYWSA